jgi:signal transduction histidine kinase
LALSESFDKVVQGIIARLIEATGADAALVRLWDENAQTFPVIGQMGYSQEFIEESRPERVEGAVGWVITHGEAIVAPDVASDPRLRRKTQLKLGLKSCAILPLTVHDKVRGVIQISSRTLGFFDEEQKDHLMAVARQMSISLENRELFYHLQNSRNELERANKVKEEFLSVMSHELRTPLSVVLGYGGMLRQGHLGPLNQDQEQALEIIQRNSQELFAMIDSIMDATKIEAGSMIAERDRVSLAQLLGDLKQAYDFSIGKNIALKWEFAEDLPVLWTDARKVRQIITNLVNNAIKFTDEGAIVITAGEKSTDDGHWIELRVSDSGIGIPPGECEKVFERFHQVDGSGTRSFEGVGLGLYIVKSFTHILGGRVSVSSEVGKGSTFVVMLPLQDCHSTEAPAELR